MKNLREKLEVVKNSTCFLSYSFCRTKEDITPVADDQLPNPPMELEFDLEASLEEMSEVIEDFCETSGKATKALNTLLNVGRVIIIEEY